MQESEAPGLPLLFVEYSSFSEGRDFLQDGDIGDLNRLDGIWMMAFTFYAPFCSTSLARGRRADR